MGVRPAMRTMGSRRGSSSGSSGSMGEEEEGEEGEGEVIVHEDEVVEVVRRMAIQLESVKMMGSNQYAG